jgi:hypothetical protein
MRCCEICKAPIELERAEAIRDTRLCLEHARQIARYGGEFLLTAVQERTSKPGSLKRNYGGIDTAKVRNQAALDQLRADHEQSRRMG